MKNVLNLQKIETSTPVEPLWASLLSIVCKSELPS
ncbi:class III lanthipeptide [Psychrobacillus sp. FSL K6-4046]